LLGLVLQLSLGQRAFAILGQESIESFARDLPRRFQFDRSPAPSDARCLWVCVADVFDHIALHAAPLGRDHEQ
jgi:hypothetical protein